MTQPPASRTIQPHPLARLFAGAGPTQFHFSGPVLQAEHNGNVLTVLPASLIEPSALSQGFLFARVHLSTEQGPLVLSGLRKKEARTLVHWLRVGVLARMAPEVNASAAAVKAILNSGYPSQYRVTQAQAKATDAVQLFGRVPKAEWCTGDARLPVFQYLHKAAHLNDEQKALLQQRYIEQQVQEHAAFFDQVESMPLTPRQREACVIDEDNNLVLAGAGTGKTSVMIGRAGYLVHSGQAQAEDILMLAFGNKAAREMQERADKRLGSIGITAKTFHKLGQDIIGAVEGAKPTVSPFATENDGTQLAHAVNQWLEDHLADPEYRKKANRYFQYYMYPEINPFDFETEGDYLESLQANNIRTLKGESVKSLGECHIANYLFVQGIEYTYEAKYKHTTATVFHRQYQPDFYLPEHDIYIEFYGIDRQKNTPPFVNRKKYLEDMDWKENLHKEQDTTLIELFHYQRMEGTLETDLAEALAEHEVSGDPLPSEAVLATLRELGEISTFATLMKDLLQRYRANCYEPGRHEPVIRSDHSEQLRAALELLEPIIEDYQQHLDEQQDIDFDDMIGKAIQYVRSGQCRGRWRYIMVDEFQDISEPRARLLYELKQSNPGCSLFCVGDDWQSIYRFTGSDLKYTTRFKNEFGPTCTVALDQTFRFNNRIGEVASRFVLRNPTQIPKELKSLQKVDRPAVSLLRQTGRYQDDDRLLQVLERISKIADDGSSVYLLSRYKNNLPDKAEKRRLRRLFPNLSIKSASIHASKGMEADYVVILGPVSGEYGTPSRKQTHPLLEALLPVAEPYPHAEERRLFYVALTRARHRVYLVTDMTVASEFVVELLKDKYPLELDEFETSLTQQLFELMKCIKCKTGSMVPRDGEFGPFYGCSKYPLCSHTESGCPTCDSQMYRKDRFRVCVNPECETMVPICPECGGDMKQRNGPYGSFWGCSNFRREGPSCPHKEQTIEFNLASATEAR
ncbi:hypothetical protein E4656_12245 [Natronospirillum operosum]|uniref:DNA 3'-5' helicase n=1 Tax=Natronospirillum operosum TaxID=2759953 RepID=A0A4Z0WEY4_9GAMM|nr:UvrD-helicase domain-containing protein [Natronospirillum operosum]TGG92886.1 hypothetical protein E4656_12245 [Natronospirillum operosum]